MLSSGFLTIGSFHGAPVRLHWSVPLGVAVFTRFHYAPGAWLGFVLVILLHELGHAMAVVSTRSRVVAVDVHGFGGLCRWAGSPTPGQRAFIAWGGVIAQALLAIATILAVAIFGPPTQLFEAELVSAFTTSNFTLIALNLLPIPPLDGAEAWAILSVAKQAFVRRRAEQQRAVREAARETARAATRERARVARETMERNARELETLDERELPPMPDEVKSVLDRVVAGGRAEHESAKKK